MYFCSGKPTYYYSGVKVLVVREPAIMQEAGDLDFIRKDKKQRGHLKKPRADLAAPLEIALVRDGGTCERSLDAIERPVFFGGLAITAL